MQNDESATVAIRYIWTMTPDHLRRCVPRGVYRQRARRDHLTRARASRQLGRQRDLGVFATDPLAGPGLPLWLPVGAVIRHKLELLAAKIASSTARPAEGFCVTTVPDAQSSVDYRLPHVQMPESLGAHTLFGCPGPKNSADSPRVRSDKTGAQSLANRTVAASTSAVALPSAGLARSDSNVAIASVKSPIASSRWLRRISCSARSVLVIACQ
jgi:hypothetical protein